MTPPAPAQPTHTAPEANTPLREEPFVQNLLAKLPADARASFTDAQLVALKVALGGRQWGVHPVDVRFTLQFWRWHYYCVLVAGRNRRDLTRREKQLARWALAAATAAVLTVSTLLGLLVLYLVKSALGIDLFPGFSLGIWSWFQQNF